MDSRNFSHSISEKIGRFKKNLSITEKAVLYLFTGIFIISCLVLLSKISGVYSVEVPMRGGSLSEGIIGTPRFINPILAVSDADKDLTALVYSGLLKTSPSGELIPDLAESYTVSNDGLTYDFKLKKNIRFQDGTPVTADDVIFTVGKAQDKTLNSSKRANWDGVTVQKISDNEITFTLKQPYAPFLGNATLGILPAHIWKGISDDNFQFSQYNTSPVGSGPYAVKKIVSDSTGIPLSYRLEAFDNGTGGEPFIENFSISFYQSEDDLVSALKNGNVDSISAISPDNAVTLQKAGYRVEKIPLSRIFGVFFNQNQQNLFADSAVRQALSVSAPKEQIINGVLSGFGIVAEGPIPQGFPGRQSISGSDNPQDASTTQDDIDQAKQILAKDGWTPDPSTGILEKKIKKVTTPLEFSLSTSDAPELEKTAEMLQAAWAEIGVKVDVKIFEAGDLTENVIRPRKYDALLFGEVIGRDLDLYAFWHSSQRTDPGLNVAMYTNIKVDKLLEDARTTTDEGKRQADYSAFEEQISQDNPAVFLYSPDFIYVLPKEVGGFKIGMITAPEERFADISSWFVETDKIWKIFVKN